MTSPRPVRLLCLGAALIFSLNAYWCRELFATEYLANFQSNEGILVTLASFLMRHPGAGWFPLWNAGLPIENTYDPVVPAAIAALSSVIRISPPLALHFLCGLFFCLLPVAWFWLLYRWGAGLQSALVAGLLYSLVSPSLLPVRGLPAILDSRRLLDVAYYGDIAHMVAATFLALALMAIRRAARTGRPEHLAAAILLAALTCLSDEFGITALALCTIALLLSLDGRELWKSVPRIAAVAVGTYLCISRIHTPAALSIVMKNSQLLGGDYRFSRHSITGWALVLAGAAAARLALRRAPFVTRFAALMAWMFGAISALYFMAHLPLLPVTERYDIELDLGIAVFAAVFIWQWIPAKARRPLLAAVLVLAAWQTVRLRRGDREQLRPADVHQTVEYRSARWIAQNLPGVRVMVGGDATYWFDYWTENPQLSGGHDGLAPNMMQRIATYTIYSGQNAGERDAAYSIFWMKAFGVGAIYVAGPNSPDRVHGFARPAKFDGVLPEEWRDRDTVVYRTGVRSTSLAHVIPAAAEVATRPIHGLDTGPAEPYVKALDDPSLPEPTVRWESPGRVQIDAVTAPGQVVSVQATYDRDWRATSEGKDLAVHPDALGLMIVVPPHPGPSRITLQFTGGTERRVLLVVSLSTLLICMACLLWGLVGGAIAMRQARTSGPG